MSKTLSPEGRMILGAVRCVICDAPFGGCDCHSRCRCGWFVRKGEQCRNALHEREREAGNIAQSVAASVLADMRLHYPEPMKAASGGFAKTLKGRIIAAVTGALLRENGQ